MWPFTRKSLASPEQWLFDLFAGVSSAAGVAVSAQRALTVPAVSAAVRTISEAVASLDVQVLAIGEDGSETEDKPHPAGALLRDTANDWTSGFELVRDLVRDALTRDAGGLAWINRVDGRPIEIIHYPAGAITVEYDQVTGEPRYRVNNTPTPSQNIIHLRPPLGRCPLSLAREAIGVALVMETHAARLFGKGAKPGGIIRTKKTLGDEGVKKMLAGWRASQEGADNAGKTAVLWDDAEWVQMTLNSVDAQFQELRLFQVQEIARAFNIPAPMLGDLSRATWSNAEQKGREFLVYTLEPWLRALEGALRRALFLADDRKRYLIRFDRDDLTRADLGQRATAYSSLISSRVINPNEARKFEGMPPYAGGDQFANPNTGSSQPDTAPSARPVKLAA